VGGRTAFRYLLADPYPYYARFRREMPVFYAPKVVFWVVSRYEDIVSIVKDPETFSNARVQEPLHPLTPEALEGLKKGVRVVPTTSTADPPLHRRTRKHAARAFSARRVPELEGRIREIANGLIEAMVPDGRADLVDYEAVAETLSRLGVERTSACCSSARASSSTPCSPSRTPSRRTWCLAPPSSARRSCCGT